MFKIVLNVALQQFLLKLFIWNQDWDPVKHKPRANFT